MKVKKTQNIFISLRKETVQKTMCFIQKENAEIIHDNSSVTQEAKKFYEKLYASHENDIVNIDIGNIATPTLSQEESDSREGPITLHEALTALKQMKNDKSRD